MYLQFVNKLLETSFKWSYYQWEILWMLSKHFNKTWVLPFFNSHLVPKIIRIKKQTLMETFLVQTFLVLISYHRPWFLYLEKHQALFISSYTALFKLLQVRRDDEAIRLDVELVCSSRSQLISAFTWRILADESELPVKLTRK